MLTLNEYQKQAARTRNPKVKEPILEGLMGLNGEAGEALEVLKKAMFQGHEIDFDKIAEEIGDCLWYLSEVADAIGVPLEIIAMDNLNKLKNRYPDGYSDEKSVNRTD